MMVVVMAVIMMAMVPMGVLMMIVAHVNESTIVVFRTKVVVLRPQASGLRLLLGTPERLR
jgi:hypothetical protein